MDVFELYESSARSYCRKFKSVMSVSKGCYIYSDDGKQYMDFLSGAGALNYGHNHDEIKNTLIEYIKKDSILMSLDLHTEAKEKFIEDFIRYILYPRSLEYKLQFTSPTGTSVVESAIKLARKVTRRKSIFAFTNAFHGMTGIALDATGNKYNRQPYTSSDVTRIPYDGYFGAGINTLNYVRKLLSDKSSGVDLPAAVIVEIVQGEGGVVTAENKWLRALRDLTIEFDIILIVDEIQTGCGRCGKFFGFELSGIVPDMVCLSKSLSGIGLPFSLLLYSPEFDIWGAGEDNGTFRGNNLAFISSSKMINTFWRDSTFENELCEKQNVIFQRLTEFKNDYPTKVKQIRGVGMIFGVEFYSSKVAGNISSVCFKNGLIIELCGPEDEVLKFLPPLTISLDELKKGLDIVSDVLKEIIGSKVVEQLEN